MLNYDDIAGGYDRYRRGGGPYMDRLARLAREAPGRRYLELGAGTANNTAALLERAPGRVTALDRSRKMIAQGCAKSLPVGWVRASAGELPFRAASFDFIYSTYMLHHIPDLEALFRGGLRVLAPGGCLASVTVPEDYIAQHPMNRYFPSFAAIDLARFQPVGAVEAAMRAAGFREVGVEFHVADARVVDADYADRVAGRFISTYDLVPLDEFEAGLARLRRDLADPEGERQTIAPKTVVVWGYV